MTGYFIFDDIDTRDFEDIIVSFDSIDESPKRIYKKIDIPARNGSLYIDEGRYKDVEHVYHIAALTKDAGSELINALASKIGYYRLEDSFNADEFYSAVFTSGADPKISSTRDVNTFKVTFTRKPQRWLTSGETAVAVDSGDTLTNPTLFESSPFLEAEGEGFINFNGYEIDLDGVPYGEVKIGEDSYAFHTSTVTVTLDTTLLNTGDAIYPQIKDCDVLARLRKSTSPHPHLNSIVSTTNMLEVQAYGGAGKDGHDFHIHMYPDFGEGFVYGTPKTIVSTAVINYRIGANPASTPTYTETVQITIAYGGADTYTVAVLSTGTLPPDTTRLSWALGVPTMYGNSTKAVSGVPIYIDCDLGEAYIIIDDEYVSLNHRIDLGSDLPKLASGSNTITFDNTITELKITPRWWKV